MSKTPIESGEPDLEFIQKRIEQLFRNSDNEQVVALCTPLIARIPKIPKTSIEGAHLAKLYGFRARAQQLLGHAEEALRDIDFAADLAPQEPVHVFLRGTWRLEADSYEGAIADFTEAMRLEDQLDSSYYLNTTLCLRALAYIMLGQFHEAAGDVQRMTPNTRFFARSRVWTASELAQCVAANRRP